MHTSKRRQSLHL